MSLDDILKLLSEAVKIKNQISRELKKEKDARRRKKLYKAIQKAIKTGKEKDMDRVRDLMFHH